MNHWDQETWFVDSQEYCQHSTNQKASAQGNTICCVDGWSKESTENDKQKCSKDHWGDYEYADHDVGTTLWSIIFMVTLLFCVGFNLGFRQQVLLIFEY